MADSNKPIVVELGIEFVVELLLFLYPYGAEQMNLPHSFWLGLGCWIVGAIIAIRMFWIFPVWNTRLSRLEKGLISFILIAAFIALFYKPVATAFSKRNGDQDAARPNDNPPANKPAQSVAVVPPSATPKTEVKPLHKPPIAAPVPLPPPSQAAKGNDAGQVGGGVNTGPCSNVQIGGSGNTATTNCGPIYPKMSEEQASKLTADVAEFKGRDLFLNYERPTTQSYALGDMVAKALGDAGLTVQKVETETDFPNKRPPSGIFLNFGENNLDLARAIAKSLKDSKFTDKKLPIHLEKGNPYLMEVYIMP